MSRKMKDSGMAWIGDIPEEWNIAKIKHHLRRSELRNPRNVRLLSLYREYGVIPKDSRSDNHNVASENTDNYKYVRPGDFVINKMKAWQGSVAVSEYEGIVSPAYYVYVFLYKTIHKRYFHYLLRSCYKDEFRRLSGGLRVGQWDLPSDAFENTLFLLPPCIEQVAIAKSLDKKCAEIDKVVEKTRESIEEYKKLKQAVITEAVTKGVRGPRPMKPSGVEWIGDIPEEWRMNRLKRIFKAISGSGFKPDLQGNTNEKLPVYKAGDISKAREYVSYSPNTLSLTIAEKFGFSVVPSGSILLPKIGEAMKKNSRAITTKDCCIDNNCIALVPHESFSKYYYYFSLCIDSAWYDNAGTIPSLNVAHFLRSRIPLPTSNEQQEIADYLDVKCGEIDRLISKKEQLITELETYKKSLIYEYVTGKKEVPA